MKRQWVQSVAAAAVLGSVSLILASCAGNPEKVKLKYLQKGDEYAKQQQYASAAIEYRNALKVDPKYTDAYVQLAKADEGRANADAAQNQTAAQQDARDAYNALTQAITIDPNRTDARMLRAKLLIGTKNKQYYQDAITDLNSVIQNDPHNAEAHLILGQVLTLQKQDDQAIQEFTKASSIAPKDSTPYVYIAIADAQLKNTAGAEQNFRKAIQLDPRTPVTYHLLAQLYFQQKNLPQAEAILQNGIQANPSSLPLYADLSQLFLREKKPEQAEKLLQSGIDANSSATALYVTLASLFESQGKPADADSVLNALAGKQPTSAEVAAQIGDVYLHAKMNDRAQAEYQRALSLAPSDLKVEEHVEQADLESGQIDAASRIDDQLLKQSPNDLTARLGHGQLLIAQAKSADAIQWLQKLSSDAPDSADAHYVLALAYSQNHQLVEANSELQQTLRLSPSSPIALTQLVRLNMGEKKYSVAQLYAQELTNTNPDDAQAHIMLGQALFDLGQTGQAETEFVKAGQLAPDDPDIHITLARFYEAEKRIPEEANELKAATQAAPKNSAVLGQYVDFLIQQKQKPKAASLVSQFVSQNPNLPEAYLLMSRLQTVDKDYSAALPTALKALQIDPKDADAYQQIGQIYLLQGNNDAAIHAYEQAMALVPQSALVPTQIASIYMNEGNLAKATALLQQALKLDPNLWPAANNLAWIYAEQNQNLDDALGLAQRAQAEQPGEPQISDTLAWVMYRKGNYTGAIPLLQDCIKKAPDSAQFHYHLGMVLVANGEKAEGKTELQAALHLKLDNQDAEQARKALAQ